MQYRLLKLAGAKCESFMVKIRGRLFQNVMKMKSTSQYGNGEIVLKQPPRCYREMSLRMAILYKCRDLFFQPRMSPRKLLL